MSKIFLIIKLIVVLYIPQIICLLTTIPYFITNNPKWVFLVILTLPINIIFNIKRLDKLSFKWKLPM